MRSLSMSELNENLIKVEVVFSVAGVMQEYSSPLTLRDFFAAFALQALVGLNFDNYSHEDNAHDAYAAADAMLAERVKEQK